MSFSIKPNPANDHFDITSNPFPAMLTVIDISGKIVLQKVLSNTTNNINIGHLEDGHYFMRLENGMDCHVERIVVQH